MTSKPLATPNLVPATQPAFTAAVSRDLSLDVLRDVDTSAPFLESKGNPAQEARVRAVLDQYFAESRAGDARAVILDTVEDYNSLFSPKADRVRASFASSVRENWSKAEYVKNIRTSSSSASTELAKLETRAPLSERVVRSTESSVEQTVGRSRNFLRAQGYHRVGGVLLGRSPGDPKGTLDVTDLDWKETSPGMWQLTCATRQGQAITSPVVSTQILYRSLLYAADERPLTVTIINTFLTGAQKIMLHPALIDCDLGTQAIMLDHFVFDLVDKNWLGDAQKRVAATQELYWLGWAARISAIKANKADLLKHIESEGRKDFDESIDRLAKAAEDMQARQVKSAEPATMAWLVSGFPAFAALDAERQTPVVAKKEFYDASLVTRMITFAKSSWAQGQPEVVLQAFTAEIANETNKVFRVLDGSAPDAYPSSLTGSSIYGRPRAATPAERNVAFQELANNSVRLPPTTSTASGVRERDYTLRPETLFAYPQPELPFRFIVQIAFESSPAFLEGNADSKTAYFDEHPWEFTYIKEEVENRVMEKLQGTAINGDTVQKQRRDDALKAAAAFTYFQRFFRNAFAERYGRDFPLQKLAQLARALKQQQPSIQPTPRWELSLQDVGERPSGLQVILRHLQELRPGEVSPAVATKIETWSRELESEIRAETLHLAAVMAKLSEPARDARWQESWLALRQKGQTARSEWERRWEEQIATSTSELEIANEKEKTRNAIVNNVVEYMRKQTAALALQRETGVPEEESAAFLRLTPVQVAAVSARLQASN